MEGRTARLRSGPGTVLTVLSAEIIEAEIATMLLSLCLFQPDVNLKRRKQPKQASEAAFEREASSEKACEAYSVSGSLTDARCLSVGL